MAGLVIFVFQDIPPRVHFRPVATRSALIYEPEQAKNGVEAVGKAVECAPHSLLAILRDEVQCVCQRAVIQAGIEAADISKG